MNRLMRGEIYLVKNGYDISFKGFEYLLYILNNYKSIRTYNVKDIYNEIAEKYDTNYSCVERNIRYLTHIKGKNENINTKRVIANLIYDFNKKKGE